MSDYTPPPTPDEPPQQQQPQQSQPPQPSQQPPNQGGPRPAEVLDRFLARLIDGVIVLVPYAIVAFLISLVFAVISDGIFFSYISSVIIGVLGAVAYIGYNVFFETSKGATIGKNVMKLKVVAADGTSLPSTQQSVKRNIWGGSSVGNIIPIVGGILLGLAALVGMILIAVGISGDTVRRQGWHDKFADGTMVLKVG